MRSPVEQLEFDSVQSACDVIDGYRHTLRDALSKTLTDAADLEHILRNIRVEAGVFLSLNRAFRKSSADFSAFAQRVCIPNSVVRAVTEGPIGIHRLYQHQEAAIEAILAGRNTIVATGTGSGKTESFLIPILSHCLTIPPCEGVKAILIYPMNSLAIDQLKRIGLAAKRCGVTVGVYVGQEQQEAIAGETLDDPERFGDLLTARQQMTAHPPDILITNYAMLDRVLTSSKHFPLIEKSANTLRCIVLDELHSYRGSRAADLSFLLRRLRHLCAGQAKPPVLVGCSATLADFDGPLAEELSLYIDDLLGVRDFAAVQPTFEPDEPWDVVEPILPPQDFSCLSSTIKDQLNDGLRLVERLTERRMTSLSLLPRGKESFVAASLRSTAVFRMISERLRESCANLAELENAIRVSFPAVGEHARNLLRSYLTAIAFANHFRDETPPLLDFRVHMFLRELGGQLKMCIFCHSYHPGEEDHCPDCCSPHLFFVYSQSPRKAIAQVRDKRLSPSLAGRKDGAAKRDYFVLIDPDGVSGGQRFQLDSPNFDGYLLSPDASGNVSLELFEEGGKLPRNAFVPLAPGLEKDPYLASVMVEMQRCRRGARSKLLAFHNSRQKAARQTLALRDTLISRFFEEFTRFATPTDGLPVDRVCGILSERLENHLKNSPIPEQTSREIQADFPVWFHRTLLSGTFGIQDLRLDGAFSGCPAPAGTTWNELEQQVLGIFLDERAIHDLRHSAVCPRHYITVCLRGAVTGTRIHCQPISNTDELGFRPVSLGARGATYSDPIQKIGYERIEEIIEGLCESGIAVRSNTAAGVLTYALNPTRLTLLPGPSVYRDFQTLFSDLYIPCDLHSSEISAEDRRRVETEFDAGSLQVLIATSTLEMGVDISELAKVLMIGVPPSDSSYVQRAGRAGRGGDRNAIIATLCINSRPRDNYYFHNPKQLIEPRIAPPSFDFRGDGVWKRHVNALVTGSNCDRIQNCANTWPLVSAERTEAAMQAFPKDFPVAQYLAEDFRSELEKAAAQQLSHNDLYSHGFLPRYGFRSDMVQVVDEEGEKLSGYIPEYAYQKLIPGRRSWVSGDEWIVTTKGKQIVPQHASGVREYGQVVLKRNVMDAEPEKDDEYAASERYFLTSQPFATLRSPIHICIDPSCEFLLVHRMTEPQTEAEIERNAAPRSYERGYVLTRQALIFRYPTVLFPGGNLKAALAAVTAALVKLLRLDADELSVVDDIRPAGSNRDNLAYVALYDGSGDGVFVAERATRLLPQAIQQAASHLEQCEFARGCPDCLRGFTTQFLAMDGVRDEALEVCRFMLGDGYLTLGNKDSLEERQCSPDDVLRVTASGSEVEVRIALSAWSRRLPHQGGNVFRLISAALGQLNGETKSVGIYCDIPYVVDALNGHKGIQKEAGTFNRCMFELLRFDWYKAFKG